MAPLAVVHRKRHSQVAGAAELSSQVPDHVEMLGGFFPYIEDLGMAVVAVQPRRVFPVGEYSGWYECPLRFQ